jgi:hypothetical protein
VFHSKSFELWMKGNYSIILSWVSFNLRLSMRCHILPPNHFEFFSGSSIPTLNNEFVGKNIG